MIGLIGFIYIRASLPSAGADLADHPGLVMGWPRLVTPTFTAIAGPGLPRKSVHCWGVDGAGAIPERGTRYSAHMVIVNTPLVPWPTQQLSALTQYRPTLGAVTLVGRGPAPLSAVRCDKPARSTSRGIDRRCTSADRPSGIAQLT